MEECSKMADLTEYPNFFGVTGKFWQMFVKFCYSFYLVGDIMEIEKQIVKSFFKWSLNSLQDTVPIDKMLSVENARAWVSMVSYLKRQMKILKRNWIPESHLEAAC